jgi:acyl-CoA oxidase
MSDFTLKLKPAGPQGPEILAAERARSNVDVRQLAHHLLHRDDFLGRQKRVLAAVEENPLFSKTTNLNLSRPDRYHVGLARSKEVRRLARRERWSREDYMMAHYLLDEVSPYSLSDSMFTASIRQQCNEEQRAQWLEKVENWEITGCYAQTELGHGSNVRRIECQARWNNDTKDFTIHSPSLTASKWWVGSLGRTANHAVVVAQLLIPDPNGTLKSYGPHQFVVQIRDLKTHEPLEGVVIGDIGPKYGYASMDNGYILFNHFRVPRSALLARYASVDENGEYAKPQNPATVYGSLTYARTLLVNQATLVLARAVTVAVRYTLIRHQFSDRDSESPTAPEQAVLDYSTVQIRVLPLLATTYALHYTAEAMNDIYEKTRAQIEKDNDFSKLAEMHAVSSGLKSLCTSLAANGIETCRRALGGHGFGGGSGLISLNANYLNKPTVEGDNWMITQQTASYLIKRMQKCVESPNMKPVDDVDFAFLHFLQARDPKQQVFNTARADGLVTAFQYRASFLAHRVYQSRVVQKASWNDMLIDLHRLSNAHCESLLVKHFHNALQRPDPPLDRQTHDTMVRLFKLFALFTLHNASADFMATKILESSQLDILAREIQNLMRKIRVDAARLVDAWSIPDYLLDSALGRFDGNIYPTLFMAAHEQNPLNAHPFNSDYRSEEIIMGEGEEKARRRILALVQGTPGHQQGGRSGPSKASL